MSLNNEIIEGATSLDETTVDSRTNFTESHSPKDNVEAIIEFLDKNDKSEDYYDEVILEQDDTFPNYSDRSSGLKRRSSDESSELTQKRTLFSDNTGTESDRLTYLMKVPIILQKAINSGDETALKKLIDKAFVEDCILRTDAIQHELRGRNVLLAFWAGIYQTIPDFVMIGKPPKLQSRVITVKYTSLGTQIADDIREQLFNHFKYNQHQNDTSKHVDIEAMEKYDTLLGSGKQVGFQVKSLVHFVLNPEMTHIIEYISKAKHIVIMEPKHVDNGL